MGNLLIDKQNKRAYLKNAELNLNPREFEILWLLASRPQRTFSVDEMINAIFRSGMIVNDKSIIHKLTENICKKSGTPFIHQVCKDKYQFRKAG